MSRFIAQVQQYQANNRGNVPKSNAWDSFRTSYLETNGDEFYDPLGDKYEIKDEGDLTTQDVDDKGKKLTSFDHTIHVYHKATCGTESAVYQAGSSTRKLAILYKLEGAGTYCGQI